jgi:hypothetical protein
MTANPWLGLALVAVAVALQAAWLKFLRGRLGGAAPRRAQAPTLPDAWRPKGGARP